jgi:hypothetical protein
MHQNVQTSSGEFWQPPFEGFPAQQPSGSAQKRTALDQVVKVRALAPSLPEMSKAAREAAFDEERNDALRQSVGLLLPRQVRHSSLVRKRARGKGEGPEHQPTAAISLAGSPAFSKPSPSTNWRWKSSKVRSAPSGFV